MVESIKWMPERTLLIFWESLSLFRRHNEEALLDIILPILILGTSRLPWVLLVSVGPTTLLFRLGDLFHHLGLLPCLLGLISCLSRSAQYPSGNHTHSKPAFGGRGGSTELLFVPCDEEGGVSLALVRYQLGDEPSEPIFARLLLFDSPDFRDFPDVPDLGVLS